MKLSDEALKKKYKYDQAYHKLNTKQFIVRINKNTEADLLDFVEKLSNFSGYVKDHIKKDMKK